MMTRLAIGGYRSLRDITVALGPLNVVTGANGSGKSSLYRALKLLADIAQGRIIQSLASEGPAIDVVGRPGGFFPRHESRYTTGPGPASQKTS
jgi:predicted ATPase